MYGWTEFEALAMNIQDIIPDDKKNEMGLLVGKLKNSEIVKSFKSRRITKNGNIINVWVTLTMLMDDAGDAVEIAITERNLEWLAEL